MSLEGDYVVWPNINIDKDDIIKALEYIASKPVLWGPLAAAVGGAACVVVASWPTQNASAYLQPADVASAVTLAIVVSVLSKTKFSTPPLAFVFLFIAIVCGYLLTNGLRVNRYLYALPGFGDPLSPSYSFLAGLVQSLIVWSCLKIKPQGWLLGVLLGTVLGGLAAYFMASLKVMQMDVYRLLGFGALNGICLVGPVFWFMHYYQKDN